LLPQLNDVPIVFYGRLVDQFGAPVPDAEITGSIIVDNGAIQGTRRLTTVSDVNGRFQLSGGKGESLGVMPRKLGYGLAAAATEFKYSHFYPESRHIPDASKPVVLKMWKLQGAEPLLKVNQEYKVQYTDAPLRFDLIAQTVVSNGGDIVMRVTRSPGVFSSGNRADWSVRIEAVEGGLMDSAGLEGTTYWAPETGYQPSATLTMSTNPPHKWFDGFSQGFFVRSRNGQVYSKLGVAFSINRRPEDFMIVNFGGVANTNSSRNWEGDANTLKVQ